jgi:hypothetical protein
LKTTRARENEFKDFVVDNGSGSLLDTKGAYKSMKPINKVTH